MLSPPAVSVSFTGDGRTVVAVGERRRSFTADEIEAFVTRSGPEGVIAEVRAQGRKGPSLEGPTCPFIIGDYTVTGQLGEGSFGRVVRAFDPVSREPLAIKLVWVDDPESRLSLRHELRYLAGIFHPGLLSADELLEVDKLDALAMPLVIGAPLDQALAEAAGADGPIADPSRVRRLFVGLLDALRALHSAGILHMDLKPSNVLVDADDAVHILDFGLSRFREGVVMGPAGTLRYMAPEVLMGQPPAPSADLYALGMILFEALAGVHPFADAETVGLACIHRPAPPLASRRPQVEHPWASIVDRLLERRPERRPQLDALLRDLAARPSPHPQILTFCGRATELAVLHKRWSDVQDGRSRLIDLRAAPGLGKSELLRHFVRQVAQADDGFILQGRVHMRDATAYRALDQLVDQIGEHLRGDPRLATAAAALPDFATLAQIFPGIALELSSPPATLSGRPERPLARVLQLLSDARPILLIIDDVQWGDADSGELLVSLLNDPSFARTLVILAGRDERSPFSAAIDASLARGLGIASERLSLGPISDADSGAALQEVACGRVDTAMLDGLVAKARGLPRRLVLCAQELLAAPKDVRPPGTDELLRDLSADEIELLRYLSAADRPLAAAALAAAGAPIPGRVRLRSLAAAHLVEIRALSGTRELSLGREAAELTLLDRGRAMALRRRLASELSARGSDPAVIGELLLAADADEESRPWLLRAADAAESALAFERAAELLALVARDDTHPQRRRYAGLLLAAGRGTEGAEHLIALAEGEDDEGLALTDRRRGAEALMASGAVERGLAELAPVLAALDLAPPALGLRGAARLVHALIAAIIRDPSAEPSTSGDSLARERATVCWSAGKILAFSEPMIGLDLCLRAIRYGRGSGSRSHVAAPMGFLASTILLQLPVLRRVGERWLAKLDTWSVEHSELEPLGPLFRGLASLSHGDLVEARAHSQRALELLDATPWAAWERSIAVNCLARILRCQGELIACSELTRSHRRDAERRGDLYMQVITADYAIIPMIAAGSVGEARALANWVRTTWQPDRYTVQIAYMDLYEAYADLYEGDAAKALDRLQTTARAFVDAGGERIAFGRIDRGIALARALIAVGDTRSVSATQLIAQLKAEGWPESVGNAALLAASLALRRHDRDGALVLLVQAQEAFDRGEIRMESAAVRLRRAQLLVDRAAAEEARATMHRLGAEDPARWAAVIAPGFEVDEP